MHKAGFVNIIGKPNMGKSTLMNALIGERLAIITPKAQTTRHRILGIVNDDDYQIVFSDTPGIIKPHYKLHESMMSEVKTAMQDADIFIFMTDFKDRGIGIEEVIERLAKHSAPVFVLINKMDEAKQEHFLEFVQFWEKKMPKARVLPFSALHDFGKDQLMKQIVELLPESPPYYDKEELTDRPMRFFMSEIVREKILELYQKEIPYSCEVIIESYETKGSLVSIRAEIIVVRESQKAIILGHQGEMIKKVGENARKAMETFLAKRVFLDLYVKVDKDWRNKEDKLKKYGYH